MANYLWLDSRKTYEYLHGDSFDGKLNVVQGKFKNRLRAYLHQKGVRGKRGHFITSEVDRLANSIGALIALQSEAHEPICKPDAQTIALSTYFIIGELIFKTDMQPILKYNKPATGIELMEGEE